MVLKYFGLSCFTFKSGETVLVTDPFDFREVGISHPQISADMVLYTQPYKTLSDGVKGRVKPSELREQKGTGVFEIYEPGEYELGGIFVRVLASPGISVITVGDVNVCYIGQVKNIDKATSFDDLGTIHYLILPVGDGENYIEWKQVDDLIKEIVPAVIIPSCYKLEGMNSPYDKLHTLDDYLKEMEWGEILYEKKLKLQPVTITEESQYELIGLEVSKS